MSELYEKITVHYGTESQYSLTVRGLNIKDLRVLCREHLDLINEVFRFRETDEMSVKEFGWKVLDDFPELAAKMIALAADMPDREGEIENLPFSVQSELFNSIYVLTIDSGGGLESFLARVLSIVEKIRRETPAKR